MAAALRRVYRHALPAGFALSVLALSVNTAFADTTDLGTVTTSAESTSAGTTAASPAAAAAPSKATLQATEPQSIIDRTYIEDSRAADADYASIAVIAPSVTGGLSSNGPGLGETKNGMRGFSDGQFNLTWDGIPFGDTNGPTHHSIAYFPGMNIGSIDVERGPGTADQMGQASYGGSMNLYSRPVSNTEDLYTFFSHGSWDTNLRGGRYDTGTLQDLGGTKATISYQELNADGYLSHSPVKDDNFAFKSQTPVGESTVITVDLNHTVDDIFTPDAFNGITWAQAQKLGKSYQMTSDSTQGNYYGYNFVDKRTDMDYVREQSDLGNGWSIDNNTYYYNYYNNTHAANKSQPGNGTATIITSPSGTKGTGIPGYIKINKYWVAGDIFKANKQFDAGLLTTGIWIEHAATFRQRADINSQNLDQNYAEAPIPGVNPLPNDMKFNQQSAWNNYQPFVEFAWKVTDKLTVTPGFKYVDTLLNVNAEANQTARLPQNFDETFTAKLPYLTANYRFNPEWSAYVQYAKGMVVPDISSYQSVGALQTSIQPQMTNNYQLGVVQQAGRLAFDADVYYVKVDNQILQDMSAPAADQPVYFNGGKTSYKGVEGEISYVLTHGFSVFANGSVNHTDNNTLGGEVQGAAINTSAGGLIYKNDNWNASYVYKHVGDSYLQAQNQYKLNGNDTTDVTVGYTFNRGGKKLHKIKVQAGIYNLQNRQTILSVSGNGNSPAAGDLLTFQAPRSYMTTVSADF